MRKLYKNLFRNLPGNDDWEGSFYERLIEYAIWDEMEFWKLHRDLINIAKDNEGETIERDLATAVVKLYAKISSPISAHFNPNDVFQIINLIDFQIYDYKERLDLAVIGVFSGEILEESRFDIRNPLLD